MKVSKSLLLAALFFSPLLVHAHPGHDGHELTWDFHGHGLWDNPLTLVIGGLLAAALLVRLARRPK